MGSWDQEAVVSADVEEEAAGRGSTALSRQEGLPGGRFTRTLFFLGWFFFSYVGKYFLELCLQET